MALLRRYVLVAVRRLDEIRTLVIHCADTPNGKAFTAADIDRWHAERDFKRDLRATRLALINRQELQQVLINGLVNAIQAMPEGGTLALASRDSGDAQIEIDIADTGPGFQIDTESERFRPFVTTKKEGTGLGLWISRSLVERYGGDIRARNRTDGVTGALLTILLPAETQASDPPADA